MYDDLDLLRWLPLLPDGVLLDARHACRAAFVELGCCYGLGVPELARVSGSLEQALAALEAELHARGIDAPPWWAAGERYETSIERWSTSSWPAEYDEAPIPSITPLPSFTPRSVAGRGAIPRGFRDDPVPV